MFHTIRSVIPLEDFRLAVQFTEGDTRIYDVKHLIDTFESFTFFNDHPEVFHEVHVDTKGYGVIWNDDIDLSAEELWTNGKTL